MKEFHFILLYIYLRRVVYQAKTPSSLSPYLFPTQPSPFSLATPPHLHSLYVHISLYVDGLKGAEPAKQVFIVEIRKLWVRNAQPLPLLVCPFPFPFPFLLALPFAFVALVFAFPARMSRHRRRGMRRKRKEMRKGGRGRRSGACARYRRCLCVGS